MPKPSTIPKKTSRILDGSVVLLLIAVVVSAFGVYFLYQHTQFSVTSVTLLAISLLCIVTVAHRLEIIKRRNTQRNELFSVVHHQLATSTSSLRWYMEMMLDGDIGTLSIDQRKHVETMQSVTENLSDLVHMILDVSCIQRGMMKAERTKIDTDEFIRELVKATDAKAREKGVLFKTNIPYDLPIAMFDVRLLRITLANLLNNAIKYTPAAGIVALNVRAQNGTLIYEVRDTGCGIPKNDQKYIFSRLFRASNVRAIDGNGFGLYVAKGAVEAQGGTITFKSKEGEGTTFTVSLPVVFS